MTYDIIEAIEICRADNGDKSRFAQAARLLADTVGTLEAGNRRNEELMAAHKDPHSKPMFQVPGVVYLAGRAMGKQMADHCLKFGNAVHELLMEAHAEGTMTSLLYGGHAADEVSMILHDAWPKFQCLCNDPFPEGEIKRGDT